MSQYQYTPLVGPIIVQQAAETITSDKWTPRGPDPVRRIPAAALLLAAVVAPLFVPDVTQAVPRLSWDPSYPDKHTYRRVAQFPAHVWPIYVPDVTAPVPAGSWAPEFPDRPIRKEHHASRSPAFAIDAQWSPPGVEPITLDKWYSPLRDPMRRVPPREYLRFTAPVYVADVTTLAPALSWEPNYPDQTAAKLSIRAAAQRAWIADRFDPPGVIVVPTIGYAIYPDQARGRRPLVPHPSQVWPLILLPDENPAVVYPAQLLPRRSLAPNSYHVWPVYVPDVTVAAPPLSWAPRYPDRFPAKPLIGIRGLFSAGQLETFFGPPPSAAAPQEWFIVAAQDRWFIVDLQDRWFIVRAQDRFFES